MLHQCQKLSVASLCVHMCVCVCVCACMCVRVCAPSSALTHLNDFLQQLEDYLQKNLITTNKEDTTPTVKQTEDPPRKSVITTGKDDIAPAMSIKQPEDSLQKSPITLSDAEEDDIMPNEGIKQQLRQGLDGMGYLQSVQHVLEDISEVHALESGLTHPELGYAGTVDCIAKYKSVDRILYTL